MKYTVKGEREREKPEGWQTVPGAQPRHKCSLN